MAFVRTCSYPNETGIHQGLLAGSDLCFEGIALTGVLRIDCRGQGQKQREVLGGCCNSPGENRWRLSLGSREGDSDKRPDSARTVEVKPTGRADGRADGSDVGSVRESGESQTIPRVFAILSLNSLKTHTLLLRSSYILPDHLPSPLRYPPVTGPYLRSTSPTSHLHTSLLSLTARDFAVQGRGPSVHKA